MRLLALLALALAAAAPAVAQDSLVVHVVRHAEKAADEGDPPLSAAGEARALALAERLAGEPIGAVVVTPYQRTRATGAHVAAARGLQPREVAVRGPVPHPQAVAEAVREAGGTVLVVGHSNTVAPVLHALGAPRLPDLCDAEYANLFTLVLKEGEAPRLTRGTYGAPDPDGAAECPRP
jgi:broad specificity phosphatase PhoE